MKKNSINAVITATTEGVFYHRPSRKKSYFEEYDDTIQSKLEQQPVKIKDVTDGLYLNLVQRQMYRRLMYGLNEYDSIQLASMSPSSIGKIAEDYKKAKRFIHILKAKRCYMAETKLINAMVQRDIGKSDYDWFMDLPKRLTLRKLGISTKELIDEFIRRRLLPKDYYLLNPETINL